LGHLTRKNPSPYDLYCVGGTLSLTQSINLSEWCGVGICLWVVYAVGDEKRDVCIWL